MLLITHSSIKRTLTQTRLNLALICFPEVFVRCVCPTSATTTSWRHPKRARRVRYSSPGLMQGETVRHSRIGLAI